MNKDAQLIAEAYKKVLNEGSKYRILKPGEILKPGDEVKSVHLDGWLRLTFKKDANGKPIEDPNWKIQPDDRKEYRRPVNEAVEQSLGNVLSSYYHEGKGLDNETLHHVIVELEEILNSAKNDPDPASALESLLLKLKVD